LIKIHICYFFSPDPDLRSQAITTSDQWSLSVKDPIGYGSGTLSGTNSGAGYESGCQRFDQKLPEWVDPFPCSTSLADWCRSRQERSEVTHKLDQENSAKLTLLHRANLWSFNPQKDSIRIITRRYWLWIRPPPHPPSLYVVVCGREWPQISVADPNPKPFTYSNMDPDAKLSSRIRQASWNKNAVKKHHLDLSSSIFTSSGNEHYLERKSCENEK